MTTFLLMMAVVIAGVAWIWHLIHLPHYKITGDGNVRDTVIPPIWIAKERSPREVRLEIYRKKGLRPVDPDAPGCKPVLMKARGGSGYWWCFIPGIGGPGFAETKAAAYADWVKVNTKS